MEHLNGELKMKYVKQKVGLNFLHVKIRIFVHFFSFLLFIY